jgi:hypothetical protein
VDVVKGSTIDAAAAAANVAVGSFLRDGSSSSSSGNDDAAWHQPYGGGGSLADDAATAAWSLRTAPLDMVDWATQNSHRTDVVIDKRSNTRFGDNGVSEVGRVLPGNERSLFRWNNSPKTLDKGTLPGGTSDTDPSAFLLGFWMSRYHNLVTADAETTPTPLPAIS